MMSRPHTNPGTIRKALTVLTLMIALFTSSWPAISLAQELKQSIWPPTTVDWLFFGTDVAIDGSTMAVGASDSAADNDSAMCKIGRGAVEVYRNVGGSWAQTQSIWPDPGAGVNEIHFGKSLSARNNYLIIAAGRQLASAALLDAGAFAVYHRTSSTANYTRVGTFFAPKPKAAAQLAEVSGVATNGSYIAAADNDGKLFVYRIQSGAVSYATTVSLPATATKLFITNSNVLVAAITGNAALAAYALSGTTATALDTSKLAVLNYTPGSTFGGDANTVAVALADATGAARTIQISNWASGKLDWVQRRELQEISQFAPLSSRSVAVRESAGAFFALSDSDSNTTIEGFRFSRNAGTGHDYNYAGRLDLKGFSSSASFADGLAFNGTDLAIGDSFVDASGGSEQCGSLGKVQIYGPTSTAVSGPSTTTKLQPWLADANNVIYLGYSVAATTGYAVLGSRGDRAFLYRNTNGAWEQIDVLVSDGTAEQHGFGTAVAINSRSIVVGAPDEGTGAVWSANAVNGSYEHSPLFHDLSTPSCATQAGQYGSSMSVDGDTLAVGGTSCIGIYFWNTSMNGWALTTQLTPPAGDLTSPNFGSQLAASGNYLVVGDYGYATASATGVGAAYVYRRSGNSYVFVQRILAPTPTAGDGFGTSVAMNGNYIAIAGSRSGVRMYRLSGSTFVTDGKVSVNTAGGVRVALSSSGLVVAPQADSQIRSYTRTANNTWVQAGVLAGTAGENFGFSLAMSGTSVIVGAPGSTVGSFQPGAGFATTFTGIK